jgi:hypothetical protein
MTSLGIQLQFSNDFWLKNLPPTVAVVQQEGICDGLPNRKGWGLKTRIGRGWQVGCGLATFIGVLVLAVKPPAPPAGTRGSHQMAMILS